jgi:hypothetical protein
MRAAYNHREGCEMRGMSMSRKLIGLAVMAALLLLSVLWSAPAGARELVEFEKEATLAANGPIPPVPANPLEQVKEVCGSETAVFGSELLTGTPPSNIKVKNEWGDILAGKDMMVSGKITHVVFSGGDLSFDHPFSTDFTFDVRLDEPYWPLARQLGSGAPEVGEHELHMELEVGQLLHALPQLKGPAEGQPWDLLSQEQTNPLTPTLNGQAHENLEAAYIPHEGDRIAARGRWIIDCGHNDFHAELHPITFMAFGHAVGSKTVVHVLSNPYRVTQLYGFGTGEVNSSSPKGTPFPQALEETITSVTQKSIAGFPAAITLPTGIERTQPSTTPWIVCPSAGANGKLRNAFVTRKGVSVSVKALKGTNCAIASATVGGTTGEFGKYTALQPSSRSCALPYPLVNAEVAGGLGISGLRVNEIERITVNASGGTFTISHGGDTTGPIPFNAPASKVQSALEALASIGPGNVAVKGGLGGPYFVEFVGSLAKMAITPLTTSHSSLTPSKTGAFLATVVVLRPGGELDLHRFVLSLIEQRVKAELEFAEEYGKFVGAIKRIEANVARAPQVACLDPLSGPLPNTEDPLLVNQEQPFPYYGEVQVE